MKAHCPEAQTAATFGPACAWQSFEQEPQWFTESRGVQEPPQQACADEHAADEPQVHAPPVHESAWGPQGPHDVPQRARSTESDPGQSAGNVPLVHCCFPVVQMPFALETQSTTAPSVQPRTTSASSFVAVVAA